MAQVDPEKLQVIRRTEQELIPERGVMLGNFGAAAVDENETWVTDSEFITGGTVENRAQSLTAFKVGSDRIVHADDTSATR